MEKSISVKLGRKWYMIYINKMAEVLGFFRMQRKITLLPVCKRGSVFAEAKLKKTPNPIVFRYPGTQNTG